MRGWHGVALPQDVRGKLFDGGGGGGGQRRRPPSLTLPILSFFLFSHFEPSDCKSPEVKCIMTGSVSAEEQGWEEEGEGDEEEVTYLPQTRVFGVITHA